jgi:hypothetical protein
MLDRGEAVEHVERSGSEAKEAPGVIAQIDAFREELLGYDAAADRSGDRWDALRVALDTKLLKIRAVVERLPVKHLEWAEWQARLFAPIDDPGQSTEIAKGSPIQVDYPPADLAEQFEREATNADELRAQAIRVKDADGIRRWGGAGDAWRSAKQMVLDARAAALSDFEREAARIRNLR